VRVNINETRRKNLAAGVDGANGCLWFQTADACDTTILDSDVCTKPWIATTINDTCISDQEIVGRHCCRL